jgi:putative SOS response-associated peptidase YedK
MCGRYSFTQIPDPALIVQPEGIEIEWKPRYNLAPSQYAPVIPQQDSRHIHLMKWGLIPHWARDKSMAFKMINARAETITEKPAYREPVKRSRCLVLADGFYEWKKTASGKQPYRIVMESEKVFYMAGISDEWVDQDGQKIHSFSIITTAPNRLMEDIHDRMPAILTRDEGKKWLLTNDYQEAVSLLDPFPANLMKAYPVSPLVGNVKHDNPDLILPYTPPPSLF